MAERRMFTVKITEADEFTSLPPTTQCLYFHLCMSADDDGFSNKIRNCMFAAHADNNDLELLVTKRFVIPFESGVVVIKHWRMHNLIRADRYHKTDYVEEMSKLLLKGNGAYTEKGENTPLLEGGIPNDNQVTTNRQPSDNQMATEVSIGKDSIGKVSIDKDNIYKKTSRAFAKPTLEEVKAYCQERNNGIDAETFIDFYECKGWMVGKNKMKDWKAAIRTWEKNRKGDNTNESERRTNGHTEQHTITYEEARELYEYANSEEAERENAEFWGEYARHSV